MPKSLNGLETCLNDPVEFIDKMILGDCEGFEISTYRRKLAKLLESDKSVEVNLWGRG